MKFVLDKRTYDILFKDAPVGDVSCEELVEAENDLKSLQDALKRVKAKVTEEINRK